MVAFGPQYRGDRRGSGYRAGQEDGKRDVTDFDKMGKKE
jgi:hypothetical protein